MQGVRQRHEAEERHLIRLAWHTAAFTTRAQSTGGLKPLRHYLRAPERPQTAAEMLAVFREFQRKGAKMKITRFKRKQP